MAGELHESGGASSLTKELCQAGYRNVGITAAPHALIKIGPCAYHKAFK
jgi:hypothetical protein